jgi:eukaryotic-like serine/threonine-protein kinase
VNEPNPEKTIFAAARQLPPEDRAAYLDDACSDNGPLRRRIEALLNASEQSGAFLEVSAAPTLGRTPATSIPLAEKLGHKVGRYKLLQQIGEGGCGVVYMAEQEEPVRRRVALKIIKLGMDTRNVITRFEAERQALALMDHPNIAKVFDAGATEAGRPYFVMELVRGLKITDYCDEAKLSFRARLDLFIQVCHAIQHAHQKGIIHRDIKPSNILVTVNDGVPVTKVIDFGIAKAIGGQRLANKTVFTAFEQFIGTPAYMSPEQTLMTSLDIDTRSDIYALGVLLYELLTGKTPFETKELLAIGLDEMRRTIREKEPERPSTRLSTLPDNELTTTARSRGLDAPKLISQLRGDLDWIVMKCLEKDRARRYETANGLTADIQRHLGNEPVVACPPGNFYRFRKFVRRNKVAFATVSAVMISLIMGLAVSAILFFKEKAAHNRADEQAAIAQAVTDFLQNDLLSQAKTSTQAQEGIAVDPNMTVRQAVDRASARLKGRFAKQPLVEASIRMTLADIYDEMNEPGSSRPHAQRALELTERILGPRDPLTIAARMHLTDPNPQKNVALQEKTLDLAKAVLGSEDRKTLDCMNNLGQAYTEAGQFDKAISLLKETVKLDKAKLGPEDGSTLWAQHDLGLVYVAAGRSADSVPLLEETFGLLKKKLGPDHPLTLADMGELANAYGDAGRVNDAVALLEEALKLYKAKVGPENAQTLTVMDSLAYAYANAGHPDKEVALFEETLKLRQAKFGQDDPLTLTSMNNLGEAYAEAGRFEDALRLRKECFQRCKSKLGPEHPDVLAYMNFLAATYRDAGKFDEALRLYQESLNLCKTKLAPGHRVTLAAMDGLAEAFESAGQRDKGVSLREEALKLSQANLGPENVVTLETMIKLASSYHNARRLREAAQLDETAVKLCKEKLGFDHNLTRVALNNLAMFYQNAGRLDEAQSLYEQTLKLYKANQGPDHPSTLMVMCNLGKAYDAAGQPNKAVSVYEEALKLLKTRLGPEHPETLTTMNNLALAYQECGRADDALPLLEETLKLRKVKLGPDHPDTLRTMNNVASAYEKAGRLAEALPLYEQSAKGCLVKIPEDPDTVGIVNNFVSACEKARGITEAERIIREFLTPDVVGKPQGSALLLVRAQFLARHAVWADAAGDFTRIIQFKPDDAWAWHCLAAVLVQEGQLDAYREHCRKSVERFGNTTDPVTAERIAKDCLILPESGADLDSIAKMAHTASSSTNNPSNAAWFQLVQALADYRQGHFTNALDWSDQVLTKVGAISERDVAAYMVQAMACQRLNQHDKARAALATGKELAGTKLPRIEGGDLGRYWLDWVTAQALLREAKALIEGQTSSAKEAGK